MRFFVDESISPRLAFLLNDAGHDAVSARSEGLESAADAAVLDFSSVQHRVLITADTDFGALLARGHRREPSVILFRGVISRRATAQVATLLANLDQVESELSAGAIVVIGDGRLRVRTLPIVPESSDPDQ